MGRRWYCELSVGVLAKSCQDGGHRYILNRDNGLDDADQSPANLEDELGSSFLPISSSIADSRQIG